jgi:hypothetical protein
MVQFIRLFDLCRGRSHFYFASHCIPVGLDHGACLTTILGKKMNE